MQRRGIRSGSAAGLIVVDHAPPGLQVTARQARRSRRLCVDPHPGQPHRLLIEGLE